MPRENWIVRTVVVALVAASSSLTACRGEAAASEGVGGHVARIEEARSAVAKRECMVSAVQSGLGAQEAEAWANRCADACPMHGVSAIRACVESQARTLPPSMPY